MTTETIVKTDFQVGDLVRVVAPCASSKPLEGQVFEVASNFSEKLIRVYQRPVADDWASIQSGELTERMTYILGHDEVDLLPRTAFQRPTPTLKYHEGDRVLEDLNTENIQLDHLILYGTFIDYRTMAGSGNNLYAYVRWDDGKEGYADEHHLQRSDKPAPTPAQDEGRSPSEVEAVSDMQPHTLAEAIAPFEVGALIVPRWKAGHGRKGTVIRCFTKGKQKPVWWVEVDWMDGTSRAGKVRADQLELAPTADAEPVTAEIVPTDPTERLTQIEADIRGGLEQIEQGKQRVWSAIAQLEAEPELLTANGYTDLHDYLEQVFGWKDSNRFETIKAAKTFTQLRSSGVPDEELPTSGAAMRAIAKVPESDRVSVLQKAGPKPTAGAIAEALSPFRVGDRVICREHPNAADDWIVQTVTAKRITCSSESQGEAAKKLFPEMLEPYTEQKAFPSFSVGDEVTDLFPINLSQRGRIFTVESTYKNGMVSLLDKDGFSFSIHRIQLKLVHQAKELPVYTPDSSPETIREGIEAGYIVPTPDAPISADGQPILIDDHIAHAAEPTQLIGRVTDYADGGRLEYVRMGKTLYIDAAVVVHQVSVTEAPHLSTTHSFKRGDLVQWNGRFWVVGKIQQHGDRPAGLQLLSYNAETLNNWVSADEVELAAELDPLGLTLDRACEAMLAAMVKAFSKERVQQALKAVPDA